MPAWPRGLRRGRHIGVGRSRHVDLGEQQLLHPGRAGNGYRSHPDAAAAQVRQVRGLLDSGLTTEMIRAVLPRLSGPGHLVPAAESVPPETAAATGSPPVWGPYGPRAVDALNSFAPARTPCWSGAMDHAAVLALYDREMREGARPDGPAARIERAGGVVRQIADASGWNGVLWSGLDAAGADRAIREQIARFTGLERDFEWKLYAHDEPADLAARLFAAGFRAEPAETLMVAEVAGLALDMAPPAGVRLVRATGPAGVDLVVDVHERAFGTDGTALRHRLLARLAADPGAVVAVAAVADGEPVAAARMELVPGAPFAGLWGGGTVEAWRGRGLYRALVAHRARAAAARGCRYLQVDALPTSRPILQRLGFHPLSATTPYVYGS